MKLSLAIPIALAVTCAALDAQEPETLSPSRRPDSAALRIQPASRAPSVNRLTLDLTVPGIAIGYARRVRGPWMLGGSIGLGGDFLNKTILAGPHFSQQGFLHYGPRGPFGDEFIEEVLRVDAFVRYAPRGAWRFDAGLRYSRFYHTDELWPDDAASGQFTGAFFAPTVGWDHVRFGPRLLLGMFTSGGRQEFGINLQPLTVRFEISW